ncbi:MAG: rod-binding protein [Alphaproteobacteria bacterium]|nr:rod-binding protein [Alphaproteobacteria bacterium]MCB9928751.1 rod-binding protein [Alphaproteobacteria bacterium]
MPPIAPLSSAPPSSAPSALPTARDATAIRKAAQAFEAQFLAQMLSEAGVGKPPQAFGGGAMEGAFSSFLTQAYAERIAESGQIGLADAIVRAVMDAGQTDTGQPHE